MEFHAEVYTRSSRSGLLLNADADPCLEGGLEDLSSFGKTDAWPEADARAATSKMRDDERDPLGSGLSAGFEGQPIASYLPR